jgi:integrase
MLSELRRTCALVGIPYGRSKGVVFHDTRHSAATNLIGAEVPEVVALTITGHSDPGVLKRYNIIRRDDVDFGWLWAVMVGVFLVAGVGKVALLIVEQTAPRR